MSDKEQKPNKKKQDLTGLSLFTWERTQEIKDEILMREVTKRFGVTPESVASCPNHVAGGDKIVFICKAVET